MKMVYDSSKYIRGDEKKRGFIRIAYVFLFALFVLPQYFGLPFPLFDLTALRIMMVLIILYLLFDPTELKRFFRVVRECKYTVYIALYLIVLTYTAVLRVNVNTFLNALIEFLCFYMVIYILKFYIDLEKFIKLLVSFIWILCILGMIEYVMGRSPFSYLEFIDGLYTGAFYRSGSYRIMGPCNHSLAYGLLLVIATPIVCIDIKRDKVNVFQHIALLAAIGVNVFLTGSRSTLAVFFLELLLLFLLSSKENIKRLFLVIIIGIVVLGAFLVVFYRTSIAQYILLQITSVLDEVLGTQMAVQFGADLSRLGSSSNYRDALPYIFTLDWLNPFLGRGRGMSFSAEINGSFVHSVDNFYAAEYIRYAYPGLIAYILFLLKVLIDLVKRGLKEKSGVARCLLVGFICYFLNLWWMDTLQTLKYVYLLIAILYTYSYERKTDDGAILERNKNKKSKYIISRRA